MDLDSFGLHAKLLIAGFAGGVAHAFAFKQTQPVAQVGSVVMGTLCANYLGPVAAQLPYFGQVAGPGGAAFIVGLTAMALIQGIAVVVQARLNMAAAKVDAPPNKKSSG